MQDYRAVNTRYAVCGTTNKAEIEAIDIRTGYPLLSTPHRYSCFLNKDNEVVWVVEQESEASLEAFSDLPSSIVQQATPKATIGY